MTINNLLENFISLAIVHGEYTDSGDYKRGNATYKEIVSIIKELYKVDPRSDQLLKLLEHENNSVKMFSATELLFTNKKHKAIEVLTSIAQQNNLLSFTASIILSEWKKGELIPLHSQNVVLDSE